MRMVIIKFIIIIIKSARDRAGFQRRLSCNAAHMSNIMYLGCVPGLYAALHSQRSARGKLETTP